MTTNKAATRHMIIVAGMHRSGTSALTRVLNLCGASLPDSLMLPVASENETGYWESLKIMDLHDEIFASVGTDWSELSGVPDSWVETADAMKFKQRLIALINEEFGDFTIGLMKDPRVCKLVPLWEAALADMGIGVVYVICLRNPLEVASSLKKRNGFNLRYALALWFIHLRNLEKNTRQGQRVFVHYQDVLADYPAVIQRVNETLGTSLEWRNQDVEQQVNTFLQDALRHHVFSSEQLQESKKTPQLVKYLYAWLERQLGQSDAASTELQTLDLKAEMKRQANSSFVLYLQSLESQERQLNKQNRQLMKQQEELDRAHQSEQKVLQMEGLLVQRDAEFKLKNEDLEQKREELEIFALKLSATRHDLIEKDKKIGKLELRIDEQTRQSKLLSQLNAKTSKDLKTVELRMHNLLQTGAWRIGSGITRGIRRTRASLVGRSLAVMRSALSFKLRNHLEINKRIAIVRDSGLFDEKYYQHTYPLIKYSYKTPLEHYIVNGEAEGRQPNRAFKPYFYATQLASEENKWHSPLVHYIKQGAQMDLDPNPNFSSETYRKQHSLSDENPLAHYLRSMQRTLDFIPDLNVQQAVSNLGGWHANQVLNATNLWHDLAEPYAVDRNTKLNYLLHHFGSVISDNPLASVVIPVFNQLDLTVHCLWSLAQFSTNTAFEVIIVNDCSTDETREILQLIPGLKVLQTDENSGFIVSCNLGASVASGKYTVFLNNDTAVLESWLDRLVEVFDRFPEAGFVSSKLLYPDTSLQEAGCVVWDDGSAWNIGRNGDASRPEFNYLRDTHYGSGCSLMTPTDLFKELGCFDLEYRPGYYEDIDYAYKVRAAGYRVLYQPSSQLIHFEGKTGGTDTATGAKQYQLVNREHFKQIWSQELSKESSETTPIYQVDNRGSGARVLFIEPAYLTPDQDAGSAMSVNLIRAMLKMRMKVSFISSESFTFHEHYTPLLQAEGVECLYRPYYQSLGDVFAARPDSWDYIFIARLHCISEVYDEVRKANPSAKIIFQTIDLSSLRERRELQFSANSTADSVVKKKEKLELRYINACNKSIIVSAFEHELLAQQGLRDKVVTMPLLAYQYPPPELANRQGIMFIGGFRHQPNVDAVKYLAEEIVPLVLEQDPRLIFYIVGGGVTKELQQLSSPNFIFMGQIQRPDSFFLGMRVSVAPLRYGAGIKGKVIQSMAAGLPCIGTPVAVEGIGSADQTGVWVADDAAGLAQGILTLCQDDEAWADAANRAYEFAHQRYSPAALHDDVDKFFKSL